MCDFNMTEDPQDSSGPSPLLHGSQLETWHMLKTQFDLVDTFHYTRSFTRSRFTRRATHIDRFDQSRLDRFYLSDSGFWIHALHCLQHIPSQTLFDHDPIILTLQIEPLNSTITRRKSSYFKANPGVLKREGTLEALRIAWISHPLGITDPTIKFSLAWSRLHNTYKSIQEQVSSSMQPLDLLTAQLVQLKLDIFYDANSHQCQEYDQLRHQIREIELNETNRCCSLARNTWMGTGDKPYKTFFQLVKIK